MEASSSAASVVERGSDMEMTEGAEEKRTMKKKGRKRKRGPQTARLGGDARQTMKRKKKREEEGVEHQG